MSITLVHTISYKAKGEMFQNTKSSHSFVRIFTFSNIFLLLPSHDKFHHIGELRSLERIGDLKECELQFLEKIFCFFDPHKSYNTLVFRNIFTRSFSQCEFNSLSIENIITYLEGTSEKHPEPPYPIDRDIVMYSTKESTDNK